MINLERYVVPDSGILNIPSGRIVLAIIPFHIQPYRRVVIHTELAQFFPDGEPFLYDHLKSYQRDLWLKTKNYTKIKDYIQPMPTPVYVDFNETGKSYIGMEVLCIS